MRAWGLWGAWVLLSCSNGTAASTVSAAGPQSSNPASGASVAHAPSDAAQSRDASGAQPADAGDSGAAESVHGLSWPIDCKVGSSCDLGYPDTDGDGKAFNCGPPAYKGHQGTDITISQAQMDAGVAVLAAADGEVLFVFDGKFDRCPDPNEPDCAPPSASAAASDTSGYRVCTPRGAYCDQGTCCCFWCFDGGNVIVIRHRSLDGVFATRYDYLKRGSILVKPGDNVVRGQKIAEVGSAGSSPGPRLFFQVWSDGFFKIVDPWAGACGPNTTGSLWATNPPWASQ